MKFLYLFFFTYLLNFSLLYSQDIIVKTDGISIEVKIDEIFDKTIKYFDLDNLSGDINFISKKSVLKIIFENGETVIYATDSEINEAKDKIRWAIDNYGLEYSSPSRHYVASFSGDYLRLILVNENGTKELHMVLLYDFSNVYEFQNISKRRKNKAFINIWLKVKLRNKSNSWVKFKMVMYVKSHEHAEVIVDALKEYNRLLISRR